MDCFERSDDISVPNKNIDCDNNELVHPKREAEHIRLYAALRGKPIADQDELIEAFFDYNDASSYAGFKSMPNRHRNLRAFVQREDVRFITLRRRDVASTSASFMRAADSGTWRRQGEAVGGRWIFDRDNDAARVARNVRYIFDSHVQLAAIPGAFHLFYEDMCNPDGQTPALDAMDEFFEAPSRFENPRPPTSAEEYVGNWQEFRAYVECIWEDAIRKLREQSTRHGDRPGDTSS